MAALLAEVRKKISKTTTKTNNFDVNFINPMLKNKKKTTISEKNFFNTFSSYNENPDIKRQEEF